MATKTRRIVLNIFALRRHYILLAILCLTCSVVGVFVSELFRSSLLLSEVSYLPYEDYCLLQVYNKDNPNLTHKADLEALTSFTVANDLEKYENIEDYMMSELCTAEAELKYFKKDFSPSENNSGKLPFFSVPDSKYSESFRKAKYDLISGRHLVRGDEYCALIDSELAALNSLGIGDKFKVSSEEYTIVGIFETLNIDHVITEPTDVPNNMIYVSNSPLDSRIVCTSDVYIKFKYPYSEAEIARFAEDFSSIQGGSYSLIPVKELNKSENRGVRSMLALSLCSVIIMLTIIFTSFYSFISAFFRKRRREFLLTYALGKKRSEIMRDFGAEILAVAFPSCAIGVAVCNLTLLRYLEKIVGHFERMVSSDSIISTSTLSQYKSRNFTLGLYEKLSSNYFLTDSLLFLASLMLLLAVCIFVNNKLSGKLDVMKTFSEK